VGFYSSIAQRWACTGSLATPVQVMVFYRQPLSGAPAQSKGFFYVLDRGIAVIQWQNDHPLQALSFCQPRRQL
jgi:hypothetical protein